MDNINLPLKSWASLRSSSSRPASRRMAKHDLFPSCREHVPVDQVLFLSGRMHLRDKGSAVLVTSEAGVAKFWDLFSQKRPIGIVYRVAPNTTI